MKKLLLVAGILALSTSVMGASSKDWAEGTVNVKAKVVQPLVLTTSDVDYGILLQGEQNKWAETVGTVKIEGTPREHVRLEVKNGQNGSYETYKGPAWHVPVELKTGAGTAANEKMTADITLFTAGEPGDLPAEGRYGMRSGKLDFTINGPLSAADGQKPGEYTGEISVRAMYD